jgi:hypothetical protein
LRRSAPTCQREAISCRHYRGAGRRRGNGLRRQRPCRTAGTSPPTPDAQVMPAMLPKCACARRAFGVVVLSRLRTWGRVSCALSLFCVSSSHTRLQQP